MCIDVCVHKRLYRVRLSLKSNRHNWLIESSVSGNSLNDSKGDLAAAVDLGGTDSSGFISVNSSGSSPSAVAAAIDVSRIHYVWFVNKRGHG